MRQTRETELSIAMLTEQRLLQPFRVMATALGPNLQVKLFKYIISFKKFTRQFIFLSVLMPFNAQKWSRSKNSPVFAEIIFALKGKVVK